MEGTTKRIADSFFKHKLGMVGLVVLIILYLVVIFADFVAPPYNFTETHRNFVYAPPLQGEVVDGAGKWVGPHICEMAKSRDPVTYELIYAEDRDTVVPLKFFVRGEKYKFLGLFETDLHLFGVEASPPTRPCS